MKIVLLISFFVITKVFSETCDWDLRVIKDCPARPEEVSEDCDNPLFAIRHVYDYTAEEYSAGSSICLRRLSTFSQTKPHRLVDHSTRLKRKVQSVDHGTRQKRTLPRPAVGSPFWLFMSKLISLCLLLITVVVYCLVPSLKNYQGQYILSYVRLYFIGKLMAVIYLGYSIAKGIPPEAIHYGLATELDMFIYTIAINWVTILIFDVWRKFLFNTSAEVDKQIHWVYQFWVYYTAVAYIASRSVHSHNYSDLLSYEDFSTKYFGSFMFMFWQQLDMKYQVMSMVFWISSLYYNFKLSRSTTKLRWKSALGFISAFEILQVTNITVLLTVDRYWIICNMLDMLHAVFLLLFLVILRKKALQGLAAHRFFALAVPQSWRTLPDNEDDEVIVYEQD